MNDFPPTTAAIWAGHLIGVFDALDASEHAHVAVQIAVGLDHDVSVTTPDGRVIEGRILVVESGERHAFSSADASIVVWADPHSTATQRLRDSSEPVRAVDRALPVDLDERMRQLRAAFRPADAVTVHQQLVAALTGSTARQGTADPRIERAAAMLRPGRPPQTVPEIADAVGLSPSRLRALFRDATGVPPARYRAWWRFMEASQLMGEGASATEAAHAAGFADAAHFTRVFRAMTGMPPSYLQHPAVEIHFVDDATAREPPESA